MIPSRQTRHILVAAPFHQPAVAFVLSAYRCEVIGFTQAICSNTVTVSAERDRVDGKLSRHVGRA